MDHHSSRKDALSTNKTLLGRARVGDEEAWKVFVGIYEPLIRSWLGKSKIERQDVDDLTQEVLALLVKELRKFEHNGRAGAFRNWLRTVTVNRARQYWRSEKGRSLPSGGSGFLHWLSQLEDPRSEMTQQWDREHDDYVLLRLIELVEKQFDKQSILAFRMLVVEKLDSRTVAEKLNMTVGSVYSAKSRILLRLREQSQDLIDMES